MIGFYNSWICVYISGMTEAADWRKCDAVAKVIACCPLQSQSVEKYYSLVAPQVIHWMHMITDGTNTAL